MGLRLLRQGVALAFLGAVISVPAVSQTTSGVYGSVADISGAVVPGASITLTNTATGITYATTTSAQGIISRGATAAWQVKMEVVSAGFDIQNLQSFTLLVDQRSQQNFTLVAGKAVPAVLLH